MRHSIPDRRSARRRQSRARGRDQPFEIPGPHHPAARCRRAVFMAGCNLPNLLKRRHGPPCCCRPVVASKRRIDPRCRHGEPHIGSRWRMASRWYGQATDCPQRSRSLRWCPSPRRAARNSSTATKPAAQPARRPSTGPPPRVSHGQTQPRPAVRHVSAPRLRPPSSRASRCLDRARRPFRLPSRQCPRRCLKFRAHLPSRPSFHRDRRSMSPQPTRSPRSCRLAPGQGRRCRLASSIRQLLQHLRRRLHSRPIRCRTSPVRRRPVPIRCRRRQTAPT